MQFVITSREEWLKDRMSGIGGSDIAAILGLNPYANAYDVWRSKLEELPHEDNDFTLAGRMLEPVIAERFEHETKLTTIMPDKAIYTGSKPHYKASVDRLIFGQRSLLECKSTVKRVTEPMESWICQANWYSSILNTDDFHIACLIQGVWFKHWNQLPNKELISIMQQAADDFWGYVIREEEPPITNVNQYQAAAGKTIEAAGVVAEMIHELQDVKAKINELEAREEELTEGIKQVMQDAEILSVNGYNAVTWKSVSGRTTIDSKRLKSERPEIFMEYVKQGQPTRQFKVR